MYVVRKVERLRLSNAVVGWGWNRLTFRYFTPLLQTAEF